MRVLVVCNAGMSSSILVKKMKDYAASQGEELMIKVTAKAQGRHFTADVIRHDDGQVTIHSRSMPACKPFDVGLYGDEQHIIDKLKAAKDGAAFVEVLEQFNLGRARFTYELVAESASSASLGIPALPEHKPAREILKEIYRDYFNNYATLMTYADQHGLTEAQAGILIALARDVETNPHPEN